MGCSFLLPWKAWNGFYYRYARATDCVAGLYNMTSLQLFLKVRYDRIRFERLKFIVKIMQIATLYDRNLFSLFPSSGCSLADWARSTFDRCGYHSCPDMARIYALYLTDVKYYLSLPDKSTEKDEEIARRLLTHSF
jgi:hypothetical protein